MTDSQKRMTYHQETILQRIKTTKTKFAVDERLTSSNNEQKMKRQ